MRTLLIGLVALGLMAGCFDTSSESSGASKEENVATAIVNSVIFLYNTHVAGTPSGAQNTMATCPLGGTVTITGTTAVGPEIQNNDLNYSMTGCGVSGGSYTMTYTGAVDQDGTYNIIYDSNISTQYVSGSLTYSGDAYGDSVSDTCTVSIVRYYDDPLSGSICGTSF